MERRWRVVALLVLAVGCLRVLTVDPADMYWQPEPDARSYSTGAYNLAHGDGYTVDVPGYPDRPRYPPGMSLVLAPATFFPDGAQRLSTLISAGLLVAVWLTAQRLGGDVAAAVSTGLLAVSPFVTATARLVMADAFGALLAVAALYAVAAGRRGWAGLLVGYGIVVRLAAGVGVLALATLRVRRAAFGAAGGVLACLVVFQWAVLGSPMGGYGDGAQFGGSYVLSTGQDGDGMFYVADGITRPLELEADSVVDVPNVLYYPEMLLVRWVFIPPGFALVGLVEMWRRRRTELGRFSLVVVAANVVLFLPYFFQSARFVAPSGMLLAVFVGVAVAHRFSTDSPEMIARAARSDTDAGSGNDEALRRSR